MLFLNANVKYFTIIQLQFKSLLFGLHVFFAFFSKFLIDLWRQFRRRKTFFCVQKIFRTQVFAGIVAFSFCFYNYFFENA